MIIVNDIEQGSPEWFAARAGVPSASCFDKIVTSKGVRSKSRKDYLYTLAGERILGTKAETFQSAAMERGIEMEEEARLFYELTSGVEVQQVGLVYRNDKKLFSCSPDGLMGNKGIEIKCPSLHTHVGYLLADKLPTKYVQQVQGSMLVTGFDSWVFMSYYPGMPTLIIEVERDADFCGKLAVELGSFCIDLEEITKKLKAM